MGNAYLFLYNAALCGAWWVQQGIGLRVLKQWLRGYVLYLTLDVTLRQHGTTEDVWKRTSLLLKGAQTAAVMEVVHSMAGLVRSPVMITAMQVASRLWVLWGVIVLVPGPTTSSAITLGSVAGVTLQLNLVTLLVAWSASEVIRYSFYAFKEVLGYVPYPSLWLRYSGFIVLYPLGVASELTMVYLALPTIRSRHLLSYSMPNKLNISLDYATVCMAVSATYVPGLYSLYSYMLVQRRRQLGGAAPSKAAGKGKQE